jgi:hypothetical protein
MNAGHLPGTRLQCMHWGSLNVQWEEQSCVGTHLQPAIPVGVSVEAAGAKRAGPITKVKVHAVLHSHGQWWREQ